MLGMKVAAFTMVRSSLPTGRSNLRVPVPRECCQDLLRRRRLPDELGMTELVEKGSPFQRASSVGRGAGVGRALGSGLDRGDGVGLGVGVGVGVDVGIGVVVGVDVAVDVGIGVSLGEAVVVEVGVGGGVTVGVAVAVAVGLGGTVAVGVTVAVGAGVGDAVGVAVGVGVAPACTSNEPASMRPLRTRQKLGPRWSKKGGGAKFGSPASMAGLSGNSACVNVGPPLSCNGPSSGLVLI